MFNTTVDSILASFNKTIAKLEALAEQKKAEAINHHITANEATGKAKDASEEAILAESVANRLRAFTS